MAKKSGITLRHRAHPSFFFEYCVDAFAFSVHVRQYEAPPVLGQLIKCILWIDWLFLISISSRSVSVDISTIIDVVILDNCFWTQNA